jgi:hypothetical protein
VTDGPLAFTGKLARLSFLDTARRVPPLVLCALCGEPIELGGATGIRCACLVEVGPCRCRRVDFVVEGGALSDEDLVLLGLRYGVLDRRPRTVAEIARALGTTRAKVRLTEARAMGRWKALIEKRSA